MDFYQQLYETIYTKGDLLGNDQPLPVNPLTRSGVRPNSVAIEGGVFGDEGKGKIVDEFCTQFQQKYRNLVVYRWNGGANAGHTLVVDGRKIVLHQLPAGALTPGAVVILGKGMVLHPGDLITEISDVVQCVGEFPAKILIDEMAVLALDTHRAFETALRDWESGGKGSTERGISPAYADVVFRHPVRLRDLAAEDWQERLGKHYDLYMALTNGLGADLGASEVRTLANNNAKIAVGNKAAFLERLADQRGQLHSHIVSVYGFMRDAWKDETVPFVFEGAQAVGLDLRYGVYPDVTASDPTFDGILASTEGLIHPKQIAVRAGTIKATYSSSVGTRRLPTLMDADNPTLATRIREDANEYGATTRRPRDIAYIDLPCLKFFAHVSGMTHLILTHLDIVYPEVPVKICTHYTDSDGKIAAYRPDQAYLLTVTPHYLELPPWGNIQQVRTLDALPQAAKQYVAFLCQSLGVAPIMATVGPERDALISWLP